MGVQHFYQPDIFHIDGNWGIAPTILFFALKAPSYTQSNAVYAAYSTGLCECFFHLSLCWSSCTLPGHMLFIILLVHICRKEMGKSTPPRKLPPPSFLLRPRNMNTLLLSSSFSPVFPTSLQTSPSWSYVLILLILCHSIVCCCCEAMISEVAVREIPAFLDRVFYKTK